MKKFDQINMIPFIDIMLVLLAIVLTTASFVKTGLIEVDIPNSESVTPATDHPDPIEISLDATGTLYFNSQETNTQQLSEQLGQLNDHSIIHLRIDKMAQFYQFIDIITALKAHNLDNFFIETLSQQNPD